VPYARLKWVTFAVAALSLVGLQFVFFDYANDFLGPLPLGARVAVRSLAVVVGVYAFNEYVFHVIARYHQALERERQRLAALHQVSQGLASLVGLERNLAPTLEVARRALGADVVAWYERDRSGAEAFCRVLVGDRQGPVGNNLRVRLGQGLAGRAIGNGQPTVLEDASRLPPADRPSYPIVQAEGLRTAMAVPAASRSERPTGAVVAGWRSLHRIASEERAFLENLANQLAVAVENWRLYRETQRVAALEERDRLAREMHDGLAQALTYLKLKAEAAQQHAAAGRWTAVASGLEDMRRAVVETLGDVRQAIVDLRAAAGDGKLDEEAQLQLLRIVQEALANVRKHSGADRAWVRVAQDDGAWTVTVADDGRGFDPSAPTRPGHVGLAIMRERAASIGGTVDIESAPDRGTRVVVRVPVAAAERVGEAG
jgi:signal transduction histidine kinase